ncbi:MAG: RHS repeat-associated core domain-containing protein [Phycisphaerae bacterium]
MIAAADRQRFSDATGTGALGDPSSSQPEARVYYTVSYYDGLNRETATVNVGTNGGSAYTRPSSVPSRSNTTLVTTNSYNDAGLLDTVTDPKGIVDKTIYDNLGQKLYSIAAWDGSYDPTSDLPPSDSADQTTKYMYDGSGHVVTMTAVMPSGENSQTTEYVYGVGTSNGSAISSDDVLRLVEYPDASTGSASTSSSGQNSFTYDALGEVLTKTDQNGSVHTYSYDSLGRQTLDSVTTLASGVDGSIRAIGTTYNAQGLPATVTSYSTTTVDPTHIVNQVQNVYNGFGQLVQQFQEQNGAVSNSTLRTQYTYGNASTGSRLTSMIYPSGETINYSYGSNGSLNDTISRLDSLSENIANGTQTLESYQYLGAATVVVRAQPQAGIELTYVKQSGESNGDAGDEYTGLDRFGRVVDQRWIYTSSGTVADRYQYTYDADGNVVSKTNALNSSFSEAYAYDDLNQLANVTRGGSAYQSWSLDALGNMQSVTTSGTTVNNTTNSQNELTGVGSSTLTYDNDGNTTTDDQGHTLGYDAWNRLVKVKDSSGNPIQTYSYDALGHRDTETPARTGVTTDLYYSSQWQVLEEDTVNSGLKLHAQYVWSPVFVDALVLRDEHVSSGDGTSFASTDRTYALHDANYNVTALIQQQGSPASWQVTQRYVYDAYGKSEVLNSGWSTTSDASSWQYMYQGGRYSKSSGLYDFRNRSYSPTAQRWFAQDPEGYVDGMNDYAFVGLSPVNSTDPQGLEKYPETKSPEEVTVNYSPKSDPKIKWHWLTKLDEESKKLGKVLSGFSRTVDVTFTVDKSGPGPKIKDLKAK